VFHVELRQFPHMTRAFNLERQELDARILDPWVRGLPIQLDERRWAPERARLTIYEGPALAAEEIGMGRGWGNAARHGREVTAKLLAEARGAVAPAPELTVVKQELLRRTADGPLGLHQVLALVADLHPDVPADQRFELAARSVWELLQEGRLLLSRSS
jgi:hypothetical protein